MEVKSETIQPRTKSKSRKAKRKQGQTVIIKWILIWEGVRISANIRHSPTSKEASEIAEDDKDPYRPTQMSGPKNKTRKMNGIKKPRDCDWKAAME